MTDLESDQVERGESLKAHKHYVYQTICAYTNDLPGHGTPGVILIGVRDDGTPSGIDVDDELLNTLAQMRTDGKIQPIPDIEVQKRVLKGAPVAVMEVHPATHPPVRFEGRAWIRTGPTRAIASLDQEKRLTEKRVSSTWTFDQRPCRGATLDDLLLSNFRSEYLPRVVSAEVLEENNRSVEQQLASLRFYDLKQGTPTYAGVLVLGANPISFVPGAFAQVVRFAGAGWEAPIADSREMSGSLVTELQALDAYLPLLIRTPRVDVGGMRQLDAPEYPVTALRELVFNAVLHRDYESSTPIRISWFDDRVEIQNPGALYGPVTSDNFGTITAYRNPVIAEAMKALGYVERFGTGVQRARAALERNGNPPPEFVFGDTYFQVTLRRRL